MKAWKHTLRAALLLLPALAAGAAPGIDASRSATPILHWQLQQLYGNNLAPDVAPPYLQMTPPGSLSGYSGCNPLSGTYLLEGERLSFSPLYTSRVACALESLESDFLRALGASRRWRAMGDQWLLLDDAGNIIAVMRLQR